MACDVLCGVFPIGVVGSVGLHRMCVFKEKTLTVVCSSFIVTRWGALAGFC